MTKKEALVALWRLLVELYGDKDRAERLADQSGVAPERIDPDGTAADYWWRVLVEAHKRDKVQAIVKNAAWEVEEREADLKQAYRVYADALDTGEPLDAPGAAATPAQGGINVGTIKAVNVGETQIIDQRGAEINVGDRKVDTGGGAYVGGSVNVSGDFVGRDKVVHGDSVYGDKISVGDISSSTGVAIGRDASASVTQGVSASELAELFAPILAAVHAAPAADQDQALKTVKELEAEATKGKKADDQVMAGLLDSLIGLVPGAVSAVVSAFASPVLAGVAGPATQYVLKKLQGK